MSARRPPLLRAEPVINESGLVHDDCIDEDDAGNRRALRPGRIPVLP